MAVRKTKNPIKRRAIRVRMRIPDRGARKCYGTVTPISATASHPARILLFLKRRYPSRRVDTDTGEHLPVEAYEYRHSVLPFEIKWETLEIAVGSVAEATHVDIFLAADTASTHYFWIARLPVASTVHYEFPVLDINTESPLSFETPNWTYILYRCR